MPGSGAQWEIFGELALHPLVYIPSSGMYGNLCLENSAGKWGQESSVRPKGGQWMASLQVTVEHGKNTQVSQEGSGCSGGS